LRHFTATEVNALTSVVVDDQVRNGWQRVVSVRVCMVVRSRHNTAARDARGQVLPIRGCDNADLRVADGAQLRRFERTFAVKNRLGATL
jgi:type IV pilus assembly protein PilW